MSAAFPVISHMPWARHHTDWTCTYCAVKDIRMDWVRWGWYRLIMTYHYGDKSRVRRFLFLHRRRLEPLWDWGWKLYVMLHIWRAERFMRRANRANGWL